MVPNVKMVPDMPSYGGARSSLCTANLPCTTGGGWEPAKECKRKVISFVQQEDKSSCDTRTCSCATRGKLLMCHKKTYPLVSQEEYRAAQKTFLLVSQEGFSSGDTRGNEMSSCVQDTISSRATETVSSCVAGRGVFL